MGMLLSLAVLMLPAGSQADPGGLEIFFIDTNGGAATLLVGPNRESVLVDTGNPGNRDADRIVHVARDVAQLQSIDHLVTTHWHSDHYGGIGRLVEQIPVKRFYDRGVPEKLAEDPQYFPFLIANYRKASEGKRTELKPGDRLSLQQIAGTHRFEGLVLSSAGKVVSPKEDQPKNPHCDEAADKAVDPSDNARSISILFRFGPFTFLDCGDLTWNVEKQLVCPADQIGMVEVYQVTHHGLNVSNNPVLIKTVNPHVAIFNNGPRKGAHPDVMKTLRSLPGLEAIYQMHRNVTVDDGWNAPATHIANKTEAGGEFLWLKVAPDGTTYTVQIGESGKPASYKTRPSTH